jgi:choline dehydrogenase
MTIAGPSLPGFDVVIVGAGTAGCLLARRLAQATSARIAVIEAGPRFPALALTPPLAGLRLRTRWSWPLLTTPQAALNHRRIPIPMGRVVGGSSAVNAMICAPGPLEGFRDWQAFGGPTWGPEAIAPIWQRLTSIGEMSPLPVAAPGYRSPFSEAFLAACMESGFQREETQWGERSGSCGPFALFQHRGGRASSAQWLVAQPAPGEVTLIPDQSVRRVVLRRGRAVGVQLLSGEMVAASEGVVLCAGAFHSPWLLQLSGIGPAEVVQRAGKRVRVHLAGVGRGLRDHVAMPLVIDSRARSPGRPGNWLPAALRWGWSRSGVMASNCAEAGCFLGAPGDIPEGEIVSLFQTQRHRRAVELMAVLLRPVSAGTVELDPANPLGPPRINPAYLAAAIDRQRLCRILDQAREIAHQPALRRFGLSRERLPGAVPGPEALAAHASTFHHPVGTCRLGDDGMAVVDSQLRVHGVERLWVVDNSVVPEIPGGHTAATALIIAEQAWPGIAAAIQAPGSRLRAATSSSSTFSSTSQR